MELGYGRELFMVDVIGSVFDSTRQKFERMEYVVGGEHARLLQIAVQEFDCVGEEDMLGDGINHM